MKTFVLTVSRVFPAKHKRKGENTHFDVKIINTKINSGYYSTVGETTDSIPYKLHTIRSNYRLWKHRIEEIEMGEAILSIRYWSGKPYNSKQVEICKLDKDSGIGVQKVTFKNDLSCASLESDYCENNIVGLEIIHANDGLSLEDFKDWFKGHDLSQPLAIIHFTKFRY